ncbi:hypothetical protein [Hymenobacter metallicola]|uniref:DUF4199 domain-containing protein n=1 Tax=Hymenobacter metallicola TaxID=2563114 RepID=A0A4Z0QBL0_9BACT|nr:hypothetical protein [Hymenobacter metallicola]TGE27420.1 hypothetical protein E5K02_13655 [Hymenobacter metallicola]
MKRIVVSAFFPYALLSALGALVLMYGAAYLMMDQGSYTYLQTSLLALLPGLILFGTTIAVGLSAYSRVFALDDTYVLAQVPKKYLYAVLVLLTVGLAYGADYLFFGFVDQTLSVAYADGMRQMMESNGHVVNEFEINRFATTAFFSQNLEANIFFVLLGYLIALPIARSVSKRRAVIA